MSSSSETRQLPAKLFQKGVHDCPLCAAKISSAAASCPRCECHLEEIDQSLGTEGPKLEKIMDFAGILNGEDEAIRKSISTIEEKFPQLKLMFCSLKCPEEVKLTTLGWWTLNRGTHSSIPGWSGLLLIDPSSCQATFQAGYELEIFVNRQKLEALLSECGEWFTVGDWSGGIENFFQELHPILKSSHHDAITTHKLALKSLGKA